MRDGFLRRLDSAGGETTKPGDASPRPEGDGKKDASRLVLLPLALEEVGCGRLMLLLNITALSLFFVEDEVVEKEEGLGESGVKGWSPKFDKRLFMAVAEALRLVKFT